MSYIREVAEVTDHLPPVGLVGFEPTTSCSQSRRAAKLRHSPDTEYLILSTKYSVWRDRAMAERN